MGILIILPFGRVRVVNSIVSYDLKSLGIDAEFLGILWANFEEVSTNEPIKY